VIAQATQQQRHADKSVEHDHHHREHRVARQRRIGVASRHDDGDGHDFDARDRQRQDHRAIRFAEHRCETLGVANHGCAAEDDHREEPDEHQRAEQRFGLAFQPVVAEQHKEHGGGDDHQQRRLPPIERHRCSLRDDAHGQYRIIGANRRLARWNAESGRSARSHHTKN
jgi:hypothetical protein